MPIFLSQPLLAPGSLRKPRRQDSLPERMSKLAYQKSTYSTKYFDSSSKTPLAPSYTLRGRTSFGVAPGLADEKYLIVRKKSYADRRSWAGFPGDNLISGKSVRTWSENGVREWLLSAFARRGLIDLKGGGKANDVGADEITAVDEAGLPPPPEDKKNKVDYASIIQAALDAYPGEHKGQPLNGAALETCDAKFFAERITDGDGSLARELVDELKCKEINFEANVAWDDAIVRGVNFTRHTSPRWKIREKFAIPESKMKVPGPGHYRQPTTLGIGANGKGHPLWKQDGRPMFGLEVRGKIVDAGKSPGPGKYPAIALDRDPTRAWAPKYTLGWRVTAGGLF
eukprot:g17332.t1